MRCPERAAGTRSRGWGRRGLHGHGPSAPLAWSCLATRFILLRIREANGARLGRKARFKLIKPGAYSFWWLLVTWGRRVFKEERQLSQTQEEERGDMNGSYQWPVLSPAVCPSLPWVLEDRDEETQSLPWRSPQPVGETE